MVTVFVDNMQLDLTVEEYRELFGTPKIKKVGRPKKDG